jgi:hypothetical protein
MPLDILVVIGCEQALTRACWQQCCAEVDGLPSLKLIMRRVNPRPPTAPLFATKVKNGFSVGVCLGNAHSHLVGPGTDSKSDRPSLKAPRSTSQSLHMATVLRLGSKAEAWCFLQVYADDIYWSHAIHSYTSTASGEAAWNQSLLWYAPDGSCR